MVGFCVDVKWLYDLCVSRLPAGSDWTSSFGVKRSQLTHHDQQDPDEVDPTVEVLCILSEQAHQDGRQHEKQNVADLEWEEQNHVLISWRGHCFNKRETSWSQLVGGEVVMVNTSSWHPPCCKTRRCWGRWGNCPHTSPPRSCQPATGPRKSDPRYSCLDLSLSGGQLGLRSLSSGD